MAEAPRGGAPRTTPPLRGRSSYDVVVLGGGIVGAALSAHLVERGAGSIALLDAARARPGATSASAGILAHPGWDPWDLALVRDSRSEYRQLSEEAGLGGFRPLGGVWSSRTAAGEAWLREASERLHGTGVAADALDAAERERRLPSADLSDARYVLGSPEDALFDPPAIARAYRDRALRGGATVAGLDGPPGLSRSGGEWLVDVGDASARTKALVLATGAWTPAVLEGLGRPLPIVPFRAQAVLVRPRPLQPEFPTWHDWDLDLYVRPGPMGRAIAGDGTEHAPADPDRHAGEEDPSFRSSVAERLRTLFPEWGPTALEAGWAGVCVASPDRFPLVGAVPGAEGLWVATAFDGLGAMRAGGIARRLAAAILDGRTKELAPADPSRFAAPFPPFAPAPGFPLEGTGRDGPGWAVVGGSDEPGLVPRSVEVLRTPILDPSELAGYRFPGLSDWFDAFVPRFLADALRTGGTAELALVEGEVRGAYLTSPVEGIGSLFTRSPAVARAYLGTMGTGGLYAETEWIPGGHPVEIRAADLVDWTPTRPVRNPVRIATPADLPAVQNVMEQVGGAVDRRWFAQMPRDDELCFLAEFGGRIAGVSWASVEGRSARGHSFAVLPRYRGLGLGTDLLLARMEYLRSVGVRLVVSEIYEGNPASETAAARAGMAPVGRMFHLRPPRPGRS